MDNKLHIDKWFFENEKGDFELVNPHKNSGIYFPLANEEGIMGAINPLLAGDIKTSLKHFFNGTCFGERFT
jgi:hypothetical protein